MLNNKNVIRALSTAALITAVNLTQINTLFAKTFTIPSDGSNVVGKIYELNSDELKLDDNYLTLSLRYDVGFHELEEANPYSSPWSPSSGLVIPHRYVLPNIREGIVINLAELRLYYFPKGTNQVLTFPVGIGKKDWTTPVVKSTVVSKTENPTWTVPESIKAEYRKRGEKIADFIKPGPDNPLGKYALRLSAAGYLIHGTNGDVGVGLRASHGCLRMFNKDVKQLFETVPVGTPVHIINEPYKIGTNGKVLFLEAHKPLSEDAESFSYKEKAIKTRLSDKIRIGYKIDWDATQSAAEELRGIPVPIGRVRYLSSSLENENGKMSY